MQRTIRAKFAGKCPQCDRPVAVGAPLTLAERGKAKSGWLCPPCADLIERSWINGDRTAWARNPLVRLVRAGVGYLDAGELGLGARGEEISQEAALARLAAERAAIAAEQIARGWRR